VDVIGGLIGVWDRAWLTVILGLGLVMAYVLHRQRLPDDK
jgi:hypothetical protein